VKAGDRVLFHGAYRRVDIIHPSASGWWVLYLRPEVKGGDRQIIRRLPDSRLEVEGRARVRGRTREKSTYEHTLEVLMLRPLQIAKHLREHGVEPKAARKGYERELWSSQHEHLHRDHPAVVSTGPASPFDWGEAPGGLQAAAFPELRAPRPVAKPGVQMALMRRRHRYHRHPSHPYLHPATRRHRKRR